jgi:peptide-methionine (S)-S-oxide reductase
MKSVLMGMGLVSMVALGALSLASKGVGAESKQIGNPSVGTNPGHVGHGTPLTPTGHNQLAIFSQGCFWGSENRFRKVPGVVATAVGYTGGHTSNPSYEDVCSDQTGHAESVLIEFDPQKVTYDQLLAIFWSSHDSTSGNRQGPDAGTQYRSAIFTLNDEQQTAALRSRDQEQQHVVDKITTEIAPAGPFWVAEGYHQQWDEKHGTESCPLPRHARRK